MLLASGDERKMYLFFNTRSGGVKSLIIQFQLTATKYTKICERNGSSCEWFRLEEKHVKNL